MDTPVGTIIGKNNDIGENKAKYHIPHRYAFPDGHKALIFTWPGTVWANAFVNESGLAFGGASVGSAAIDPAGFPSNFVFRVVGRLKSGVSRAKAQTEMVLTLVLLRPIPTTRADGWNSCPLMIFESETRIAPP